MLNFVACFLESIYCGMGALEVTILGWGSHFQMYGALYVLFNLENSLNCFDIIFGLLGFQDFVIQYLNRLQYFRK